MSQPTVRMFMYVLMFPLPELFMKLYQFLSGHNVPEAQSIYLQMT